MNTAERSSKTDDQTRPKPTWYLRSLGDHDTHRGELRGDGTVLAHCEASFTPRPTLKVVGPPPGELVTGDLALKGSAGSGTGVPEVWA